MKNLLKSIPTLIVLAFFAFSFSSCDKDYCYECSAFDDGTFRGEAWEMCEDDPDFDQDVVDFLTEVSESGGADCRKY